TYSAYPDLHNMLEVSTASCATFCYTVAISSCSSSLLSESNAFLISTTAAYTVRWKSISASSLSSLSTSYSARSSPPLKIGAVNPPIKLPNKDPGILNQFSGSTDSMPPSTEIVKLG